MKRLLAAILLALLVSFGPTWAVDCTEQCDETPLSIVNVSVQQKTLHIAVYNSTGESQTAVVRAVVESGGDEIYIYGTVTVAQNGISLFSTTFQHNIQVVSCTAICANAPDHEGGNEGPDPIGVTFEEEGIGSGQP